MRRFYVPALLFLLLGAAAHAQGIELAFFVRDWSNGGFKEITATLVFEGRYARVWVDNVDTSRSAVKSALPKLIRALDTMIAGTQMNIAPRDPNKGILQNDIEVFGDVPNVVTVEGKTDFLMTDLGTGILGYFSPLDQTLEPNSNKMNLLYINSRQGVSNLTMLLSTIAHEFQHLIQHNRFPRPASTDRSHSFFNEGMSENANLINGYFDRQNPGYLANTNVDLFTMRSEPPSAQDLDYQRAMTFVHYMREQFGERFLYEFAGMHEEGMTRITKTLELLGIPMTGQDVLVNFAVANLLQINPNPAYGYQLRLSTGASTQNSPRRATVHASYTGTTFPASANIVLQPHGIHYIQYTSPGPMTVRFGGASEGRAVMIGVRNGQTEVVELQQNTDYTLPMWAGGPFERVTIAFVNGANGTREATWSAQPLAADVAIETGALDFGIAGTSVDEAAAIASVRTVLGAATPARLDLFDLRGARVRTLELEPAAGAQLARIDIAGLSAGGYIARLSQDGRSATSSLVVAR